MNDFRQDFLAFALARDVLRFGEFVTKAGRKSPYFFNAGLFNDGESLRQVGRFYAEALLASGLACDQLFGPAYKGITLAAATGIALAEKGHNLPYSYNRKEGANPAGVLIALDRMERGQGSTSAVQEVRDQFGIPVVAIATLDDVMAFIAGRPGLEVHAPAVKAYRARYGA